MKTMTRTTVFTFLLLVMQSMHAQDPSFAQFFASPLNINPALTANINADWRVITNLRDQWIGPASPYVTGTVSYDTKLMKDKWADESKQGNHLGIGTMLMFDHAMSGVVKSTYGSLNLSYNIKLFENEQYTERLGIGFGTIYGYRRVDFNRIDFEEQFTGTGFNTSLPTGEAALSNTKPYLSVSAGLTYSASSEKSNFDIGVAAFHLNSPKQTFLEDEKQVLAIRKVAHANFETFLKEQFVLNASAAYQYQANASYFSVGGALGFFLDDKAQSLVMAGLWYWSDNALLPYVGLAYKDVQFGLTYDITTSKLNQATRKPNSWEVSMILRGKRRPSGVIPCPWK